MKRRFGITTLLIAALAAGVSRAPVLAQAPAPPLEEMKRLAFLVGEWDGVGNMEMGPGQASESRVHEAVQWKLGGAVLLVEGVGKADVNGEERIVHNALGVVSYDRRAQQYRIRAYRADGNAVDADVTVGENELAWQFEVPGVGKIRYTIRVEGDQWVELGEMSRDDGATWHQFFTMTLDRKS